MTESEKLNRYYLIKEISERLQEENTLMDELDLDVEHWEDLREDE